MAPERMSNPRYLGIILVASVPFAIYHYVTTRPVERSAGVLVAGDPEQTDPDSAAPIADEGFVLQPRARFTADARVLSRERYHMGKLSDVSPLDIAVGWGPMSDSAVLADLDISQGNRFYYWHYDDEPPIPREVIQSHSANWHLLPATDAVWHSLRGIRVGDVVHLEGLLVDVESGETGGVRTSLTRDDTGPGACEIIYVDAVSIGAR
jgi:hypothetical protein